MRWIVLYKYGDKIRLTSYILKYLTPELLIKIERTTRRYELNNNQKGKIIQGRDPPSVLGQRNQSTGL